MGGQEFANQFKREVCEACRCHGSKLRHTAANKGGSVGLNEFHVGEWIDSLDELRVDVDTRQLLANKIGSAQGRIADELIIKALGHSDKKIPAHGPSLARKALLDASELLDSGGVPDDGGRYAVIGWKQWKDLMGIPEFKSALSVAWGSLDQVGELPKYWLGTTWIHHSGLPLNGGTRNCYLYHESALVHAIGRDVKFDIIWHEDFDSLYMSSSIDQGAALIDYSGVVQIQCLEAAL